MSRLIDFNKISECCSYSKKDSELTVADVENFLEIMLANSHKLLLGAMRIMGEYSTILRRPWSGQLLGWLGQLFDF